MDKQTMRLVEKYYKAAVFLSFEEIQRKLEEKESDQAQAVGDSLQEAADAEAVTVPDDGPKKRGRKGKDAAAGNDNA